MKTKRKPPKALSIKGVITERETLYPYIIRVRLPEDIAKFIEMYCNGHELSISSITRLAFRRLIKAETKQQKVSA